MLQQIVMRNNNNGHMARITMLGNRAVRFEYKEHFLDDPRTTVKEHANVIKLVKEGRKNGFEIIAILNGETERA